MNFYRYFFSLPVPERAAFAAACGSTVNRLTRVARGYEPASPQLCVAIDRESNGRVHYSTVNDEWLARNAEGDGRKRIPMDWAYVECKARASTDTPSGEGA